MHRVDLGESFPTHILLQNLASIQPLTSPIKFARSPRTDPDYYYYYYRSPRFSYGVANRGCSVRIPRDAEAQKYGYFEDRRPASNMDPYIVTKMIVQTTCL